jgi:hypothetical protein
MEFHENAIKEFQVELILNLLAHRMQELATFVGGIILTLMGILQISNHLQQIYDFGGIILIEFFLILLAIVHSWAHCDHTCM